MPTLAEGLSPSSSMAQIKAAISDTIAQLINEGVPQEQAIAEAYSMAEKATGKSLGKRAPSTPTLPRQVA